jgi:preprotein translocase subunit Sec61beta
LATTRSRPKGEPMSIVTILIIVILVLLAIYLFQRIR